ncbi:DNA repair protein RecO [Candidatus Williamhamiltonella defendens]|uniref:DNA repair protein RecO n=1 Tax=Candidatus Hamiltonella defensa (Bemisia tabaci) TaxID=672795 RepID=A0A249E0C9_9ENTR|nr:DNA repair protein RecO [Candidatus Hamiltonella defensa]ASX26482.1 DNA repair protein RecO [Candidatus Hamiltonella defensa (Bemisia tabaci)]CED79047.1 DNA repair protein RecO [Candidatus Hamiltonella defensa (Bemisia tabaci)]
MHHHWHRSFILHRRPYSETSLILDLLTENEGRISLIAKGALRPRSVLKGYLQPFTPLLLRWSGKSAIKTLCDAEPISIAVPLTGIFLYSGLYVNELLSRLLLPNIDYRALFFDYLDCLEALASAQDTSEQALRRFELALLTHLGYGVDFLHCVETGEPVVAQMTYRYQHEIGFIRSTEDDSLGFTGHQLQSLAKGAFYDQETLKAAKRFTRIALKPHLGHRPLNSRSLFRKFNLEKKIHVE